MDRSSRRFSVFHSQGLIPIYTIMKPKNLYLDDLRPTPDGFDRVYGFEEFIEFIIQNGLPDFISFDHDLGEGKSGFVCAKLLVK